MNEFIVDESKFIITDEENTAFFPNKYPLATGIVISELEDSSENWQLYISEDSKYYILAVTDKLYNAWICKKFLSTENFIKVTVKNKELYLLFSPSSLTLTRLCNIRINSSSRYAHAVFSAFIKTRQLDIDSNLRDGIYFELYSLILPTYSLIGKVSDKALLKNALRNTNENEDLSAPKGHIDTLTYTYFHNELKQRNINVCNSLPYFECGETAEFFVLKENKNVFLSSPLIINENYQLFDTSSDYYVLVLEKIYANALFATSLLQQMDLNSISLNGQRFFALCLSKKFAVECLNDRHYGIDFEYAIHLVQALKKSRTKTPNADFKDGLYLQELGIVLPLNFSRKNTDDKEIITSCLYNGPFSMGRLLEEEIAAVLKLCD